MILKNIVLFLIVNPVLELANAFSVIEEVALPPLSQSLADRQRLL